MSDRYGGAYIDGLNPYTMGPIGGELQQQLVATGDLSQAGQTLSATGNTPVATRRHLWQGRAVRYRPAPLAIIGSAALRQKPQRMRGRGTVRVTRELHIHVDGERLRVFRLEGETMHAVERQMEKIIAEVTARVEAEELVELVEQLDRHDRQERASARCAKVLQGSK